MTPYRCGTSGIKLNTTSL